MLLNKKRGLLLLSSLFLALLIPLVSAQYEGVYSMFSFLFGAGENEAFMFLKAGIWIVLFAIIFWLAKKIFSGSKGIATIFSIVVSLISIRFIPNEYIFYIGSAYGVFGIVVLILAIIGGTLLILNSYFPIKEHKAFGVVWALFYFFIAWVFHQLTDIITGIYQIDELLPVMGPWGKWVCIVLGIACLIRALSGKGGYARKISSGDESKERDREREELERERIQHKKELNRMAEQGKKDVKTARLEQAKRSKDIRNRVRREKWQNELNKLRSEKNDRADKAGNLHARATKAGWTKTEAGRKLYKEWYRESSKVGSLQKEIKELEKNLGLR